MKRKATMSQRYWATLTAIAVLIASGLVCRQLTGATDQLDAAAARVADVPRELGDWRAHDEAVDQALFDSAGAKGHWTSLYVNQRTHESVLVILMCGRAGRMAVHTPEVCYCGAGYELPGEATACEFKSAPGQESARFFTAQFTKKAATPTNLRLYWAWNAQGQWEAAPSPRWQFRGAPFLYKLYVSRTLHDPAPGQAAADPTTDFLRQFVPVLNRTLFPAS
jgi:hypothetical protein